MSHPQLSGAQVANIINPVKGVRDQQRRDGKVPVDYMKKNLLALKETERKLREMRMQRHNQEASKPAPFKLKKFQHVHSKFDSATATSRSHSDSRHENQTHRFLRKGERSKIQPSSKEAIKNNSLSKACGVKGDISQSAHRTRRAKIKEPVPKATDLNDLAPRTTKNFISNNYREASENRRLSAPKPQKITNEGEKHENYGKVPVYLLEQKRKKQQENEMKLERELNGEIPEGMVVMDESERLRMLDTLNKGAADTQKQMDSMPLRIETEGQKRRMKKLEDTLKEQQAAIEIFSKDRVLVYEE